MGQLNDLYRAFLEYRKCTAGGRDLTKLREFIARANSDGDEIKAVTTTCKIDEDWIEEIEKGLEYIGKAIAEDRQFIRSNGEVLPIEKVKSSSRESVEHLARHSELLTKEPDAGGDIIPDKLYSVERLTDYAVYENRFLYMLLCYLREFVSFRYDKILQSSNEYDGSLNMNKTVDLSGRVVTFETKLTDRIKDDKLLRERNPMQDKLNRIDGIMKGIDLYLATPLMQFVSKEPMLKPPITETNILKMNKNFKGAMALYYFVTSYEKPGYTVEKKEKLLSPVNSEIADEMAEFALLCIFLTYEHGMGIEDMLKEEYRKEEEQRAQKEHERFLEQIESMKKRVQKTGKGVEEYALLLEKRNRELEEDVASLLAARAEIERLTAKLHETSETAEALNKALEQSRRDAEEKEASLQKQLETERTQAEETLNREREEAEKKLAEEREESEKKLKEFQEQTEEKQKEEFRAFREETFQKANEEQALAEEARKKFEAQEKKLEEEGEKLKSERDNAFNELAKVREEKALAEARCYAVLRQNGSAPERDFTSKEAFDEVERQYLAFKAFYKEEWKKTKKRIRKETLTPSEKKK